MSNDDGYADYDRALEQREAQEKRRRVRDRPALLPRAQATVIMAIEEARGSVEGLDELERQMFEVAIKSVKGAR